MSPNAWPGGELVPRDRNGARLHDNEIVSARSYVCAWPGGQQEGMLGWEDPGWRLLLPWEPGSGVLGGMHKQPSRINALWKQSLERVGEFKPWCSCCCFAPSPSCLTGRCAEGDGAMRDRQIFPFSQGGSDSLGVAVLLPGAGASMTQSCHTAAPSRAETLQAPAQF